MQVELEFGGIDLLLLNPPPCVIAQFQVIAGAPLVLYARLTGELCVVLLLGHEDSLLVAALDDL